VVKNGKEMRIDMENHGKKVAYWAHQNTTAGNRLKRGL
jgi:hypothetical protein